MNLNRFYDRKVRQISVEEFGRLSSDDEYRRIGLDSHGDATVSTVWLGIDHNYLGDGPPLIFETMIFGGKHDQTQWRATTEKQAYAMHAKALAKIRLDSVDENGVRYTTHDEACTERIQRGETCRHGTSGSEAQ